MARTLAPGQRAAVRFAVARRGELKLTQKQLAQAAAVSERTVSMFETYKTWPNANTLARLERLGLEWPVGYLTEYAAKHSPQQPPEVDGDIAAILESNLHPDLKLRLIDRLRDLGESTVKDDLHDQLDEKRPPKRPIPPAERAAEM